MQGFNPRQTSIHLHISQITHYLICVSPICQASFYTKRNFYFGGIGDLWVIPNGNC
jgi:hypothetical protein